MVQTHKGVICAPLIDAAEEFRHVLRKAREAVGQVYFSWYPYDSLGNAVHLTKLLDGSGFDLMASVRGKRILDLGCADGDFAFFLESLGASVIALDHPRGNHNNLAGIRALKQQMNSSVQIREADLDAGFTFGEERFELAIALGLLYHLRNPFQFLESLSKCTRYCLLSTRIMRRLPGVPANVAEIPVAYLLGADELNSDNSNFWIFTEAALRRLLHRAHWRVAAWTSVGTTENSDPHTLENDERAFCLIESTWGDVGVELVSGWHEPEDTGWRWTERRFAVCAQTPGDGRSISANIYVPDALFMAFREVTVGISVNGVRLAPERYTMPGLFTLSRQIPVAASDLQIEFEVNHALPPDEQDLRERSLIVESIRIQPA